MVSGLSQAVAHDVLRVGVALIAVGIAAEIEAVYHERMMQRHRRPGVSYWSATLRRDGGWRRSDLFNDEGLSHQRRAATWGMTGVALILAGLVIVSFV